MKLLTALGIAYLVIVAAVETAAAAQGGMGAGLSDLPDWVIYVGLAVICPEDLNRTLNQGLNATIRRFIGE